LKSEQYIINELYRFGGINSIRGFNENSLQANQFTSLLTEYRYLINPSIYIHSIIDYGYYQDQSINRKGSLIGLGIGIGLQTKNGLFNIIYANGSSNNEAIKSSNSIVHLSFKTIF
jgi:hemolysin activation/secretion protein